MQTTDPSEPNGPSSGEVRIVELGRTDRLHRLVIKRDIAGMIVVLFALVVMALVIIDNNATEDDLREQIAVFRSEERAIDLIEEEKLECRRRYQAVIDSNDTEKLNLLNDYIVILTLTVDQDERRTLAEAKARELEAITRTARAGEHAKIEYDNLGNPLPCPIPAIAPSFNNDEEG